MADVWACQRLILEGVSSRRELEDGSYSIDDVVDENDALDAWQKAKAQAEKPPKR